MLQQMKKSRPNIIWVFGDQHRAQATGYAGDPNLHTPNLDRFAAESANCARAFSGFPLCCPARGSLLTGVYPHKCVPGHECPLPEGQRTVADELGDAGYRTAYFGKWHLAGFKESEGRAAFHITDPARRGGFDEWLGYENNNSQFDCWVHGGERESAVHYKLPAFETDALTNTFIDYLERQARGHEGSEDEPFFAVLSVQPPHDPYTAPEEWMKRHNPAGVQLRENVPNVSSVRETAQRQLAGYYALIENLDWNFGRIRSALDRLSLAEDTYILFFSDHGDMHGSHGQFKKNSPWEESIRVPLLIGGGVPFYDHKLGSNHLPINMPDIPATTLGLAGLDLPDYMQGKDFSGVYLKNKAIPEAESGFLQGVNPTMHGNSIDRPWRGVISEDGWKFVCLEGQPWLLFDLNSDPYEQVNLAHNSKFWGERVRLYDLLKEWIDQTGDRFDLPERGPGSR